MNIKELELKSSRRRFIIGGAVAMAATTAPAAHAYGLFSRKSSKMTKVARDFFEACETGKGWEECKVYCHDAATFSSQTDALEGIDTLEGYTEWMKGLLTILEDGHYDLKSFATDKDQKSVVAFAIFTGTHTGEGGPVPPTGKTAVADYVYDIQFDGDRISHMTKIWNDAQTMRQLGWA